MRKNVVNVVIFCRDKAQKPWSIRVAADGLCFGFGSPLLPFFHLVLCQSKTVKHCTDKQNIQNISNNI